MVVPTPNNSLNSYLDNLKTDNVERVIQQVLEDPNIHVFGEILQTPAVQEWKENGGCKDWIELLEIFAYGTWREGQDSKLWSVISDEAKKKLKRLTVVQFASKQKQLNYSTLMDCLELHSVRELEDWIMDCIEYRLVRGKLDQKQQIFHVEWTMGRDVSEKQLDEMIESFYRWEKNAEMLLQQVDSQVAYIQQKETEFESERTNTLKQLESAHRQIREQQLRHEQEMELQSPNERNRRDKRAKRRPLLHRGAE